MKMTDSVIKMCVAGDDIHDKIKKFMDELEVECESGKEGFENEIDRQTDMFLEMYKKRLNSGLTKDDIIFTLSLTHFVTALKLDIALKCLKTED